MFKFLFFLILLALIIAIILYAFSRLFLHMPRALQFKSKKNGGMLSSEWMDWMEEAKPLGSVIYEYVVPRKTRQERYARSHEVHFCAVINDKFYDTDIADGFWVQYTKLLGTDPCAKHYYRTQNGEFFSITATLGKKDQFSTVPEKEMKRLLKDEPTLYAAYIPHASENKDLREYTVRQKKKEEEEAREKEQKEQVIVDTAKEEKPGKKKKKEKLQPANPFRKWMKPFKENSEQKPSVDVEDKKEDAGKDPEQATVPADSTDSSKNIHVEEQVDTKKGTATDEPAMSNPSQESKESVNKHKNDKQKPSVPENTISEDMDELTDMANAFNESSEVNSEQQGLNTNKKSRDSEKKNKKNNKSKNNASSQEKTNNENTKPVNEKDNVEQKKESKNEDKEKVTNEDSSNVSEKPAEVPTPKKQRQKRKGSQMTDLPNDIGYDNVAAVEKQQELENAMFEEPVQEEDMIEEELKKEEEKKKEMENQEKFRNLDKVASNMDAMKYRTVSKGE